MPEKKPLLQIALGVIKNPAQQVLVALRPKHVHQGGLWEFPGGKIAPNETILQALTRELKEELNIAVTAASPLITLTHDYTDLSVQLNVLRVDHYLGQPRGHEGQAIQWTHINDLDKLPFPAANRAIISAARLPQHYAILDAATLTITPNLADWTISTQLLTALQHLLNQGITLIQARIKLLSSTQILHFLNAAIPLCTDFKAELLINADDQSLWGQVESLHITSQELMTLQSRPHHLKWLAASCHSSTQLEHAYKIGVDFTVLAPVLPTQTHPQAESLGWSQFSALVTESKLPVYALGGLKREDLTLAQQLGAQGIAGIRLFMV